MDSCQNQNLKFDINLSKQDTRKKKLDLSNDFDKVKIQHLVVEVDQELEQLQQSPSIRPVEQSKIAKIQEIFCKLFHQFCNIEDIREYSSHKPTIEHRLASLGKLNEEGSN
jgi:hypothetical protein